MSHKILSVVAVVMATAFAGTSQAAVFTIGDNDGYGLGIPDGGSHKFDLQQFASGYYDGRSEAEKLETDGGQYTDTYSTTHEIGHSPQEGSLATFTFADLGENLKSGTLEVDMAEIEATAYGPVLVNFNGIVQDWAFDDGSDNTKVRDFTLSQTVINSINSFGELVVTVDRNNSGDYYGFDYLKLTVDGESHTAVTPVPAAIWLFGSALVGMVRYGRRK